MALNLRAPPHSWAPSLQLLGGEFRRIMPSDLRYPGAFAKGSLPTTRSAKDNSTAYLQVRRGALLSMPRLLLQRAVGLSLLAQATKGLQGVRAVRWRSPTCGLPWCHARPEAQSQKRIPEAKGRGAIKRGWGPCLVLPPHAACPSGC